MKAFYLSRSKTKGDSYTSTSSAYVSVTRQQPKRVIKTVTDSWTGKISRLDYFTGRVSDTLCPGGVLRVSGLRIQKGQCIKVKLVRVK